MQGRLWSEPLAVFALQVEKNNSNLATRSIFINSCCFTMEAIHTLVKVSIPKYLQSLRIPKTFGGLAKLSGEDWINLCPLIFVTAVFFLAIYRIFLGGSRRKNQKPKVNQSLMKEDPKVVTQMDIEDIGDKIAFCRCWRSKKFPLCDGSHNEHNASTRDNVGPLLLRRSEGEK